jgi:hypothetical protein
LQTRLIPIRGSSFQQQSFLRKKGHFDMSLRLKSVGIAVTVGLAFAGCGKSAKNAQPGDAQQPQTGPAWSLTLKSACTQAEEGQCLCAPRDTRPTSTTRATIR